MVVGAMLWGRTLSQRHEFPADLNPFAEDAMLVDRINQWKSEMRDEWRAEGRVEGRVEGLIDLVREGLIDRTGAAVRLSDLHARGGLNDQQLAQALARLG